MASSGDDYEAPARHAVVLDGWNPIGASFNAGADQFIVYVNGSYNEVSGGSPTLSATTDVFYVDRHDNGARVSRWRGQMSMVGLYNEGPDQEMLDNVVAGTRNLFGL